MAKALDQDGTGKVERSVLRSYAAHLGIAPRQWQRWINRARELDLVRDVQRSSGGRWDLILSSAARAALAVGADHVGPRKAYMAASDLVGPGSRARVWAAFEVMFKGRPISRAKMEAIAGVAERTQRARDVLAETMRVANYSKTAAPTPENPRTSHFASKSTFPTYKGEIAWRLPDARHNDLASRGRIGRARKANKLLAQLRHDGSLYNGHRPLSHDRREPIARLFYESGSKARAALIRLSQERSRVQEIYQLQGPGPSGAVAFSWWRHCPA